MNTIKTYKNCTKILDNLYKLDTPRLDRKYFKFQEYLNIKHL